MIGRGTPAHPRIEASFSRGHFELQADLARSRYEVPGFARDLRGTAWFVEPKVTFTPRPFAALRYERNDYPYIQAVLYLRRPLLVRAAPLSQ